MKHQRTIHGVKGDRVTVTLTPDPLNEVLGLPPIPLLHVSVTDAYGDSCTTDKSSRSANVVGVFTVAGARRLHKGLGDILRAYDAAEAKP